MWIVRVDIKLDIPKLINITNCFPAGHTADKEVIVDNEQLIRQLIDGSVIACTLTTTPFENYIMTMIIVMEQFDLLL